MTKLLLRKSDTWHRLDSLKFEAEIGSTDAIVQAINEICAVPGQVKVDPVDEYEQDAMEEREVIDLTFDDGDVYAAPSNALQSQILCQPPAPQMAPHVPSNIKTEDVSISLDAVLSATNSIAGPSSVKLEDTSMDDAEQT
jgi:Fanconi-associated nuclease 1